MLRVEYWEFLVELLESPLCTSAAPTMSRHPLLLLYASIRVPVFPVFDGLAKALAEATSIRTIPYGGRLLRAARRVFDLVLAHPGWIKCNHDQYLVLCAQLLRCLFRLLSGGGPSPAHLPLEVVEGLTQLLASLLPCLPLFQGSNSKKVGGFAVPHARHAGSVKG